MRDLGKGFLRLSQCFRKARGWEHSGTKNLTRGFVEVTWEGE